MEEHLEVLEGSDCEINRLFPKCQPRYFISNRTSAVTDLNLNRIRGSNDNDNYRITSFSTPQANRDEEVTSYGSSISSMSVDTASATSSASGSHTDASASSSSSNSVHCDGSAEIPAANSYPDCEEARSSVLDSSYEEPQVRQSSSANALRPELYHLRDSRIEAAGGREVYSQSRNRPRKCYTDTRKVHGTHPFYYHNAHSSSHASSQFNQLAARRHPTHLTDLHKDTSSSRSDTTLTSPESSFEDGTSGCSSPTREATVAKAESPLVYETQLAGSTEVVFDDIGEWVTRGLHVKGYSGDNREKPFNKGESYSHSQSEQDSELDVDRSSDRVRKIGNVPIAEYEGSPRRYGPRTSKRHHSPRSLYLLPPVHRIPRPGFPRRVSSEDKKSKDTLNPNSLPVWEKSYSQKNDRGSFRSSNSREKKYAGKGKSRACVRERRNEIACRNKDIITTGDAAAPSFNRAEGLADVSSRKPGILEECYQKVSKEGSHILNSIPHEEKREKLVQPPTISISTLASVYSSRDDKRSTKGDESADMSARYDLFNITNSLASKYCDYEESETHKVLHEFFQGSYPNLSKQDFLDLEYTLKRHQGNSYVGQRLASEIEPEELQEMEFSKENIDLINQLPCALSTAISVDDESNACAEEDAEVSQDSCFNNMQYLTNPCNQQQLTENTSSSSSLSCLEGTPLKSSCDMPDINIFNIEPSFITTASSFPIEKEHLADSQIKTDDRVDSNNEIAVKLEDITDPSYFSNHILNSSQIFNTKCIDNLQTKDDWVEDVQSQEFKTNKLFYEANMLCTSSSADCIYESMTSQDKQCYPEARVNAQVESSRNMTVSPSTTCDSGDAESEYSAGDLEGSVHSSLKGVCPTMPILEDGLSSGEESDSVVVNFQSKLDAENELPTGVFDQSNEDIECNGKNPIEVQMLVDTKADFEIPRPDIVYGKSYQVRARSFDDHLCRGELPTITNRVVANNIRRELPKTRSLEPSKTHSLDPSLSPGYFTNSHGFSFNIPDSEPMLKHSSPYRNPQPSPSSSTLSLMKKQITEIEREIALKKPDCLSRKFDDVIHSSLDIHMLDPLLEKICEPPPPPAPHPHRGINDMEENGLLSGSTTPGYSAGVLHSPEMTHGSIPGPQLLSAKGSVGSPVQASHILEGHPISHEGHQRPVTNTSPSRESVEAAIADIKQAIRKTKNVSLKNHSQERPDSDKGPVWVPRSSREFCEQSATSSPHPHEPASDQQSSPSRESIPSRDRSEEDGDTDQETDRLLGRQRSRDPGYINDKEKEKNKKKGKSKEVMVYEPAVLIEGVLFRARYLGSTQLVSEGQPTKTTRMMQAEEAVSRIKAPEGEPQPSTEVDLFISTEKIMVLNTDLKEIMMDHSLRTISYIADIGELVVLMARRRVLPSDDQSAEGGNKTPKMICHVFESDEAQFIAQSIGQAFQVAYLEFLKANGIEDHSFVKEMDYQEVLNSQEIFGDELQMFAKKELQKEVVVPKMKSEILGVVVVESGWGSMVPTVVIANLSPTGAAAKCGQLNIGDQIIAINGVSLVGLPLSTCQNYIKNTKYNTAVKLTVVPCPPVVEVKIRRPDTKYQLGFSVQNGVICSLLRGGIAERGGVRVGHRIIDINSQSVVAVPHEKIVNLLATSVGEIRMKTMPTSIFRLLTGQETPQYI